MPPALGVSIARARAGGRPYGRWVGCAGPAARWGHWHRDPTPAENRCSQIVPGVGAGWLRGRGSSRGDGCAGQRVGGLQLGAESSLGRGRGGEELCWGPSPAGKVLTGKAGASL